MMLMYADIEGRVPIQVWVTPEMRAAVKQAARRAGITQERAGREAIAGWLEWTARVELEASRKIVRENAEKGVMISA
jgi:hypothetical protein